MVDFKKISVKYQIDLMQIKIGKTEKRKSGKAEKADKNGKTEKRESGKAEKRTKADIKKRLLWKSFLKLKIKVLQYLRATLIVSCALLQVLFYFQFCAIAS